MAGKFPEVDQTKEPVLKGRINYELLVASMNLGEKVGFFLGNEWNAFLPSKAMTYICAKRIIALPEPKFRFIYWTIAGSSLLLGLPDWTDVRRRLSVTDLSESRTKVPKSVTVLNVMEAGFS